MNLPCKHPKIEKQLSIINLKSEVQGKVENIQLRGSRWKFIKYLLMRVLLFRIKVTKWASYVHLPKQNQAVNVSKF